MGGSQNADNPALAGFDWHRFGKAVRDKLDASCPSARKLAPGIGVTHVDLSRAGSFGQRVSVEKFLAICIWLDLDPYTYFIPGSGVKHPKRFTLNQVKQSARPGQTDRRGAG